MGPLRGHDAAGVPTFTFRVLLAMLLLSAWSTNGWLPSGHAMRMALDLGLHRALEKLADGGVKRRTDEEERHLGKDHSLPCSSLPTL